MKCLIRVLLAAGVLGIAACASVPMAPSDSDRAAKMFAPPPRDRAHVYIYRNESIGAAIKMDLSLDGIPAGTTVAHTFTLLPVRPGRHSLVSEAENNSELPLFARPGEIIFVWQEVKMGLLYARCKLQLVSPAVGQQGVLDSDLIDYPPPDLPPLPPRPAALPPAPPLPVGAPTPAPAS